MGSFRVSETFNSKSNFAEEFVFYKQDEVRLRSHPIDFSDAADVCKNNIKWSGIGYA